MKKSADKVLAMVDEKLLVFFEKYGFDSKKAKGLHASNYVQRLKEIVGVVAGNDQLEGEVFSRIDSTQGEIDRVTLLIAEQQGEIDGNVESISVLREKLKNAVLVSGESELLTIENNIEGLERGVKRCAQRIEALKDRVSEKDKYLQRLQVIKKEIVFVAARRSFETSKARYDESLEKFLHEFSLYEKSVRDAVGKGIVPRFENSLDDLLMKLGAKARLSVIAKA